MDRLRFFSMGSGSSGNCYYIGTASYGFLIDAGVAVRTVKRELKEHGLSFENIWGIFITHDHTDHIKAVGVLGEKYHIPVYVTAEMHKGINRNYRVTEKLVSAHKFYKKGDNIVIRDFTIQAFPVSHDASDCVGYSFIYGNQRFVIATDLGFIGKEAADHIVRANYLVIEANYDDNSSIAFYKSLESIQSIDEIKSIFLDYGEIFDLGDYYGGSMEYNFKDKHFKRSGKPNKEWLSEVEDLF